ncbi:hypothetical protein KI387_028264, partial [Taxus chinensis]
LALQAIPRMMITPMKDAQMEEHMEGVFMEDLVVTLTIAEEEVSSREEPVITVGLQSIIS